MDAELVIEVRRAAAEVFGDNRSFAVDDVWRLAGAVRALRTAGHELAEALGALIIATDGEERLRAQREAGLAAALAFEQAIKGGAPEAGKAAA